MIKDPIELVEQYLTEPVSRLAGRTGNLTFDSDGEDPGGILPRAAEAAGGMDFSQFAVTGEIPPVGEAAQPPSADPSMLDPTSGMSWVEIRQGIQAILERAPCKKNKDGDFIPGPIHIAVGNIITILRNDPQWRNKLQRNTMDQCVYMERVEMPESFTTHLQMWLLQVYKLNFQNPTMVSAAISYVADENPFNPLQEKLLSLVWDGKDRIPEVLEVLKIKFSPLHYHYFERWLLGCVIRGMCPGEKMDYILVMSGPEGAGKSTFFNYISYGSPWFSDSGLDIGTKDGLQSLQKRWIYEVPEIDHILAKSVTGELKAWVTSAIDAYRAPYAKEVSQHPRTCVLAGTTNKIYLLGDHEGDRRFWVVIVGCFVREDVIAYVEANRDQIWAQMMVLRSQGVKPCLPKELEEARKEANAEFQTANIYEDILLSHIKQLAGKYKYNDAVREFGLSMDQVFTECDFDGKRISIKSNRDQQALAESMKKHGMYKRRVTAKKISRWFFSPGVVEEIMNTPTDEFLASTALTGPMPNGGGPVGLHL